MSGTISVGGDLSGQAAIGSGIHQETRITHGAAPTDAELADLRDLVEQLRAAILEQAPPDLGPAAGQRADQLVEAVLQTPS